jgi:hypothetical protein
MLRSSGHGLSSSWITQNNTIYNGSSLIGRLMQQLGYWYLKFEGKSEISNPATLCKNPEDLNFYVSTVETAQHTAQFILAHLSQLT